MYLDVIKYYSVILQFTKHFNVSLHYVPRRMVFTPNLRGWFLPREKMLRVHVHDPVNYINTGTITPGKCTIKPRWWNFTFNNYICRKQFSKLFPSFEDYIKTKFVVHKPYITLLWYTRRKNASTAPRYKWKGTGTWTSICNRPRASTSNLHSAALIGGGNG